MFDRSDGPILKDGPGEIAAQDINRQEIPGASEYVRVRREDLKVVKTYSVLFYDAILWLNDKDKIDRLIKALENDDI